jgi:hypothetical protein
MKTARQKRPAAPLRPRLKSEQISVRLPPELFHTLQQIQSHHRISPVELARGLLESAADFYLERGYFGFPVEIYPVSITHRLAPGKAKPRVEVSS